MKGIEISFPRIFFKETKMLQTVPFRLNTDTQFKSMWYRYRNNRAGSSKIIIGCGGGVVYISSVEIEDARLKDWSALK